MHGEWHILQPPGCSLLCFLAHSFSDLRVYSHSSKERQNNLANLRAWFSWLGDLKHLAVVCSVIPRQFSKCLFLESPSSPAFTYLSVFYSHQNDTLVLTHWHSGLSWANVCPCITAQVLGINCYRKPLGDILLMSWLPDALSSQLSDRVWYRMPQSCLLQTHQCGWVSFHSPPGLWNPSSSTAPLPPCTPTGTSSQCRAPSLGSKWLKHVSEVKYLLKVFLPWVGLGLGLTGVFLWVRVEKILFLLCPPLVPFQKIPHFDGNME